MFTQCPRCATIFRVSAEILRAAAGQVRCGRCGAAFSALARLEERPDAFTHEISPLEWESRADRILGSAAESAQRAPAVDAEESGEPIERLQIVGPPFDAEEPESLEFTVPPRDLDRVFIAPPRVEPPQWPLPLTSDAPPTEEPPEVAAPEDGSEPWIEAEPATEPEPEPVVEAATPREPALAHEPLPPITAGAPTPGTAAAADQALLAAARRAAAPELRWRRPARHRLVWLWAPLALLLALLLAAQVVNREREYIASHTPFGYQLRALYARLGLRLPIPADLHDYQLRQWGVTGTPAATGILHLRASILNNARVFQPYPWLRVTFTDQFGNLVGRRNFAPREYLGRQPTLMAPGERTDLKINIVDPGKGAEGFEIDVCLRGTAGEMVCDSGGS